jgi:hypothetical protein
MSNRQKYPQSTKVSPSKNEDIELLVEINEAKLMVEKTA